LKLGLVAVVRNEVDIIRPFLTHVAALFDYALLLDHGSTDGTEILLAAACQAQPGWDCWGVEIPGHHQALFSSFAMRHLFRGTDADFVVFLDADEFLDVPDRAGLEAALGRIEGERVAGRFAWVDCLPARLDGAALRMGAPIWARSSAAPFYKLAVPRRLYDATGGALRPSSGNHRVEPGDGQAVTYSVIGNMLHIPLRSVPQLRQKIVTGALGVLARRDNAKHENSHWFDALRRLAAAGIGDSELIHLAKAYGRQPESWPHISLADLPGLGFVRRRLDVAAAAIALPDLPSTPDPWRAIAAVLRDWHAEDGGDIDLVLEQGVLRRAAAPPAPVPAQSKVAALESELAQAREALQIMRASTSYRITAPLRAMMRRLKRS
jgi:hypothetical protein